MSEPPWKWNRNEILASREKKFLPSQRKLFAWLPCSRQIRRLFNRGNCYIYNSTIHAQPEKRFTIKKMKPCPSLCLSVRLCFGWHFRVFGFAVHWLKSNCLLAPPLQGYIHVYIVGIDKTKAAPTRLTTVDWRLRVFICLIEFLGFYFRRIFALSSLCHSH